MEYTAEKIAAFLGGTVEGNGNVIIKTVSKIEEGQAGTLSFLANPKYTSYIYDTKASAVIVNENFKPDKPVSATLIRVKDAYKAFADLLEFYNQTQQKSGIADTAVIHDSAQIGTDVFIGDFVSIAQDVLIGNNVTIYPHVVLLDNVEIGDNTILYPNVTVYKDCKIGTDCIIHSGSVIGADGFGFAPQEGKAFKKIPQSGNVIIEDNVEIGANCAVDRATMGSTILRKGVKLDNFLQVAHNVEIGENTVIAAHTGISGSAKVGKNSMIGGQVGIAGHLKLADNLKVGAQAGIMRKTKKGDTLVGTPAMDMKDFFRSTAIFNRLPEMQKRLNDMEKQLEELIKDKKKSND